MLAFIRLGGVFASVMTGNLVLLGLAAGQTRAALALRAGLALAGYTVGTAVGTRITEGNPHRDETWPSWILVVLAVELVLLSALAVGLELTGERPSPSDQLALLGVAAVAMGLQSAAVRRLGVPGLSTTYMTGTLTAVIAGLVGRDRRAVVGGATLSRLAGLFGGAGLGGVLLAEAPAALSAVQLVPLGAAVALAWFDRGNLLSLSGGSSGAAGGERRQDCYDGGSGAAGGERRPGDALPGEPQDSSA